MIRGSCHTNLDEYRFKNWPKVFARIPEIGERVEAEDGMSLKICQLTHASIEVDDPSWTNRTGAKKWVPVIKVELHK